MKGPPRRPKRHTWTVDQVAAIKERVLSSISTSGGGTAEKNVRFCLKRIDQLRLATESNEQMEMFFYVYYALYENRECGALKLSQVNSLAQLAQIVIKALGIDEKRSRLSYLYGNVFHVLSQSYRKHGNHLQSVWYQRVGCFYSEREEPVFESFEGLSFANRLLRLGFANSALAQFSAAEVQAANDKQLQTCRIGRIKCLRFLHRFQESAELIAASISNSDENSDYAIEVGWEKLLVDFTISRNIRPLIKATRRGETHYHPNYVLETFFWANIVDDVEAPEMVSKVASMRANEHLKPARLGNYFTAALSFEYCLDPVVPIAVRLQRLGKLLNKAQRQISIERHLILLSAVLRLLRKMRRDDFCIVVLDMYKYLSLTLTDGRSTDVTGQFEDLATGIGG